MMIHRFAQTSALIEFNLRYLIMYVVGNVDRRIWGHGALHTNTPPPPIQGTCYGYVDRSPPRYMHIGV